MVTLGAAGQFAALGEKRLQCIVHFLFFFCVFPFLCVDGPSVAGVTTSPPQKKHPQQRWHGRRCRTFVFTGRVFFCVCLARSHLAAAAGESFFSSSFLAAFSRLQVLTFPAEEKGRGLFLSLLSPTFLLPCAYLGLPYLVPKSPGIRQVLMKCRKIKKRVFLLPF